MSDDNHSDKYKIVWLKIKGKKSEIAMVSLNQVKNIMNSRIKSQLMAMLL